MPNVFVLTLCCRYPISPVSVLHKITAASPVANATSTLVGKVSLAISLPHPVGFMARLDRKTLGHGTAQDRATKIK